MAYRFPLDDEEDIIGTDIYGMPRNRIRDMMMSSTEPYEQPGSMGTSRTTLGTPNPTVEDIYNPSHVDIDRLRDLYSNMPTKDQYQPSKGRRIFAGLASLASVRPATYYDGAALGLQGNPAEQQKIQDLYNYAPYYDKKDDFDTKAKGYENLARLENQTNANDRIAFTQSQADKARQRSIDRQYEQMHLTDENADAKRLQDLTIAQGKQTVAEKRATTAERRADSYVAMNDWKRDHPKQEFDTTKDGQVVAIDPVTHIATPIKLPDGTPLTTDDLSDRDELRIRHQNRLSEIAAQGAQTRQNEGVRQTNRKELFQLNYPDGRPVRGATGTGSSSVDQAVKRWAIDNPKYADFLEKDKKTGTYQIESASSWRYGHPGDADYEAAVKSLQAEIAKTAKSAAPVKKDSLGIR